MLSAQGRITVTAHIECDNAIDCGSTIPWMGELGETLTHARAKGWHIYAGFSLTGKYIDVRLCPSCIGTSRSRLPPAPENLDGQLDLFEEDEPVADIQRAFDEGTKFTTRSPDEQGSAGTSPTAGRDPASNI